MHNEHVDVLIIGAGPAGLACAEVLGNSGLSVLILEKNKVVGPKVCAGGVTGLAPVEDIPAGEAAGLVSAASGEGIAYALTSGEDIGRHIVNPEYNFEKTYRLLQYKQRQETALKVLDSAPIVLQDIMFMIFVRLLTVERLRNYFEGVE